MARSKGREDEQGTLSFTRLEEKLRTQILRSGLPYSEIERRCGVSVPVISRFVGRQRGLTSESFCKLLELLGIEFAVFTPEGQMYIIEAEKDLKGRPMGRLTHEQEDSLERNFLLRNIRGPGPETKRSTKPTKKTNKSQAVGRPRKYYAHEVEMKGAFESAKIKTGEMVVEGIRDYEEKADESSAKGASTMAKTKASSTGTGS